jgi:hypothetical protein
VNLHNKRAAGAQGNIAGRRAAVVDGLPRHLRALALAVEKLSISSQNPEAFVARKGEITATLESLAAVVELDHGERAARAVREAGR